MAGNSVQSPRFRNQVLQIKSAVRSLILGYRDDLVVKAEKGDWPNRFRAKDVYRLLMELKFEEDSLRFGFMDVNIALSPQFSRLREGLSRLNAVSSGIDVQDGPAEILEEYVRCSVDFMESMRGCWQSHFQTQHISYIKRHGPDSMPRFFWEKGGLNYSGRFDIPENAIAGRVETVNACMNEIRLPKNKADGENA